MNLKSGIRECAKHECFGCKFDRSSHFDHNVCQLAFLEDWIKGYKFHEKALEFLNIYDVMNDWDTIIYEARVEKNPIEKTGKGINVLLPSGVQTSGNSFGLTSYLSRIKKKTNIPRMRVPKNHFHQRKPYHNDDDGYNSASFTSVYIRKKTY